MTRMRISAVLAASILFCALPRFAGAEVSEVRMSRGLSFGFLPLIVMEDQKLIEKHARTAGLGDIKVTWHRFSGGVMMNDALLSGQVDFAGGGPPPFAVLWAKTQGSNVEVKGVAAMCTSPMYLLTHNPAIKSIKDFGPQDRILMPGANISNQAVVLQMLSKQAFGDPHKLNPLTAVLSLPDGFATLLSRGGANSQFSGPPFQYQTELLKQHHIHRVLSSDDVLGSATTFIMMWATTRFYDANPKTYAAVYAALGDAINLINSDHKKAAEIFLRVTKEKLSLAEAERILDEPDLRYSLTPENIMKYVDFLHSTGTIKKRPASWKGLFFPGPIQDVPGS
ncbi:ABC transporter substrate-binding protein [Paralcaligenes ureilyticus]|uniref:NitT/TauT family transport system substrate-binding protein n=1 Tax=Paralcaligenes ureilyticus TaxID=627131 RepID=A0A4R3LT32_9BURK|nr:ABC transporter substrate-binding protein [Paralcaligenes ureilyticus]TCT03723.1 NitT/TauT family transport system substrate-binding protein [Paralcaligenes ureilyticus]